MRKKYGLKLDKKKDPNAYVLGGLTSLPKIVLQSDGQWDAYLPEREAQNALFETYNCTAYGTNAVFETLFNRHGLKLSDRSDRWLGIKAGTKAPGNDPHKVAQSARDFGLIEEATLPYKALSNINEYFSFKGSDELTCDLEAQDFLKRFTIGHEYVWNGHISKEKRMALIKEALTYSPLGVSVTAWHEKDGVYVDKGEPNNHWTMAFGYTDKGIKIFDSYDNTFKLLDWNHKIQVCKRYLLTREATKEDLNIVFRMLKAINDFLNSLKPKPETQFEFVSTSTITPIVEEPIQKYDWDTPTLARHSVRVICDEEGLTVEQKNTLCATVGAESGWKPQAIGKPNSNGSRDWGICQINDRLWIGKGKDFPSTDYVLANPEACIRWMCKWWKVGKRTWWIAYKNGSYKKYL